MIRVALAFACMVIFFPSSTHAADAPRPNILLILADDLGFSDLGCYGSEISTPNLDRLAAGGLRFTQFYNCARCCPTRAALLTGLYPHQAGVGHMLGDWKKPAYSTGLNEHCVTIAEMLHAAGYRTYHIGKWHVGGVGGPMATSARNFPLNRGFDRYYGTGGGGSYFDPKPLFLDRQALQPGPDYYITDALTDYATRFIEEHGRDQKDKPFFLHLCYTAPHFPLHAKPADIAKYWGKYREGWDALRDQRYARQKKLGVIPAEWKLSPRDPVAQAWVDVPADQKDEWDLRMAVYAAMIDCLDQGVGRVLDAVKKIGAEENTLVFFLSDNGASAEFLDTWPNPARGHKPGSVVGTRESHRCIEVGWANAANTPFREHKMWVHEGGISTPLIAYWPAAIKSKGGLTPALGHVTDFMPTCLELAGTTYPKQFAGHDLTPLDDPRSLVPVLQGKEPTVGRYLYWEHEGNRAIRHVYGKLVAEFNKDWELYDLQRDRTETVNLAPRQPRTVMQMARTWQRWADRVGVVPWKDLPGGSYKPTPGYRKKSEPPAEK
jgi:arylsulfatase